MSGANTPTTSTRRQRPLHERQLEREGQGQRGDHRSPSSQSGRSSRWIPRLTPSSTSRRRRAVEQDPPLQHDHAIDHVGDRGELVGHEQHASAVLSDQVHEGVPEPPLGLGVDAGDRFIQHEQLGLPGERAGDEGSLLLPAGELRDRMIRQVGEIDGLERVVHRRRSPRVRSGRHQPRRARRPVATISLTVAGTSGASVGRCGT